MEPTLLIGDRILVDKSVYRERAPERGDIVTFSPPLDAEPRTYVKRTLGLPGDTIQVRNKALYVNGNAVDVLRARPSRTGQSESNGSWNAERWWPRLDRIGRAP